MVCVVGSRIKFTSANPNENEEKSWYTVNNSNEGMKENGNL